MSKKRKKHHQMPHVAADHAETRSTPDAAPDTAPDAALESAIHAVRISEMPAEVKQSKGSCVYDEVDIESHLPSRNLEDILTEKTFNRKSIKQRVMMHHSGRLPDNDRLANRIATVITDDMSGEADTDKAVVDILRDMTGTTLSMKRKIRKSVRNKSIGDHQPVTEVPSWFTTVKYDLFMRWQHIRYQMGDLVKYMKPWQSSVKTIEGQFGTGVGSYFRFVRWIFFLNIPVFLLAFFFIVIPHVVYRTFDESYVEKSSVTFGGSELILGNGSFTDSELYYGFYDDITINIIPQLRYSMKYAYLFTSGAYYLLCLTLLSYSMAKSYRAIYVRGHYDFGIRLMERIFCGWQNGIISPNAATLHHCSIYNELKEYLHVLMKPEEEKPFKERMRLLAKRIGSNLLVFLMIALAAYLVYFVSSQPRNPHSFWSLMGTPLLVCSLLMTLPYGFAFIGTHERYEKPENKVYMGMVRTMLLKIVVLGTLIYQWLNQLPCQRMKIPQVNSTLTNTTSNDANHSTVNPPSRLMMPDKSTINDLFNNKAWQVDPSCKRCWETEMAQEIYRLVILDFIFIVVSTFFIECVFRHLHSYITKKPTNLHFNIGRNTLDIIFSQVLIWIGSFYSPLISLVMIVKLFFIFYIKRISASLNLNPSDKPWVASRAQTVFLAFLFMFFIAALVTNACGIIFVLPTAFCGPYQRKETVYLVVKELIATYEQSQPWLHNVINFVSSSGFVSATIVFLCIGNYFAWIIKNGHKEMVVSLKSRLTMEGRDKAYLMKRYREMSYDLKIKSMARKSANKEAMPNV